ncbi:MAG: hypothetical protein KDD27_09065 [Saprospiraceae bacterium]|nr:hypothetical protein [Saprospiraceae bacterium]
MQQLRLAFTLCLAFLPMFLFCQIQLEGNLKLGDTTQVHVLYTTNGDRLVGRVTAYNRQTISFLFKNTTSMEFKLEDVEKIIVQGKDGEVQRLEPLLQEEEGNTTASFFYEVVLKNGKTHNGTLLRISKNSLNLECSDCPSRTSLQEVETLKLSGRNIAQANLAPARMHVLKTTRGDIFVGQLLHYSEPGGFLFLLENGDSVSIPTSVLFYAKLQAKAQVQSTPSGTPSAMNGQEKLMFGTTAFQLPGKTGEFRSTILFFHSFDYGLTNFLSIGAGVSTFQPYIGASFRLKAGFSLGKLIHIGVGAHAMGINNSNTFDGRSSWDDVLAGTASLTVGTRAKYVNLSLIHGKENLEDEFNPVSSNKFTGFTIGGAYQVTNHLRFFAEHFQMNWKDPETPDFSSIGISWFEARHRIDAGIAAIPNQESELLLFPVAGYSIRF